MSTIIKTVEKTFNYDKIIDRFGASKIDINILNQIKDVIGYIPFEFDRKLIISHRDFDVILNAHKNNFPFYIYTGRGPSSESLHLGHLIPFYLTKQLQDIFNVHVIIQITDDEKFLYRQDNDLDYYKKISDENIKDIISCGFNPDKTFIFKNTDYIGKLYDINLKIQSKITINQIKNSFGIEDTNNVGRLSFPTLQMVPCFPDSFDFINKNSKCLVICGIDQDPYFRIVRDISNKLGYSKPALLHTKFFPSLSGVNIKMSSSIKDNAIFVNDDLKIITKKINKCFSGGKDTKEEHELYGGNTDIDVCYNILEFIDKNDLKLKEIKQNYESGKLLTGNLKKYTIGKIYDLLEDFKSDRINITSNSLSKFLIK